MALGAWTLLTPLSWGQVSVLTANYDNNRTNANMLETTLTDSNVRETQFGRLFAMPVDGAVYAQPLYVYQLNIPGAGTHNVVFVATMHDSVYAFDADVWSGQPLWQVNLGTSVPSAEYYFSDISPEVGILGTPVIDPGTQTMYVVSDHYESGVFSYRLHALNIATGAEQQGGPVTIQAAVQGTGDASVSGQVAFDASQHLQRPGLLLANGTVYIAFGSHADRSPFHGWVMGYSASNISQQTGVFCTAPNGSEAAVWQSGRGLAADADGNVYLSTGNGSFDGVSSFGESILKLTPGLELADWFTPDSWLDLNAVDHDLGSAGVALFPGIAQIIGGGKDGEMYVVPTSQLGHTEAGNQQVKQQFAAGSNGIFSMALWSGQLGPMLFVQNNIYALEGYQSRNGAFETNASLISGMTTGTTYEGISVSSSGSKEGTGIVWVTMAPGYGLTQPGELAAFEATDLTTELWDSSANPNDNPGYFTKFTAPMVANGKVYVPTLSNQVVAYGLQSGLPVPQVTAVTNAASYAATGISPGEIVTVFGVGLGPAQLEEQVPSAGAFGADDDNTQVFFNGIPAPLIYSSSTSVSAVVPFGISGSTAQVVVSYQDQQSAPFSVNVAAATPGLFSLDASGTGPGAFLNQDLTVNSASRPATRGQVLVLYGTGNGLLAPVPADGAIVTVPPPVATQTVAATVGGIAATVLYAGAAPGSVAGLIQVNVLVPDGVTPGTSVPVTLQVGDAVSQDGVTAAIQ